MTDRRSLKPSKSVDTFLTELGSGITVDMSDYRGYTKGSVTVVCPEHGPSTYRPPRFLLRSPHKCKICAQNSRNRSRTKTYQAFLIEARSIHGDRYTYPDDVKDFLRKTNIEIECRIHGTFMKKAQKHLRGQGCVECMYDRLVESGRLPGGYTLEKLAGDPELASKGCTLYYLKVGRRYKIGIAQDLASRVKSIRWESKAEPEVLKTYRTTLIQAFSIEQRLLERFAEFRISRRWSTELFDRDVLGDTPLEALVDI